MTTQNEYRLVQDLKDSLAHYFKEDIAPDVDQYGLLGEICGNHYFGLMQALKAAPQPAPSNEAAFEQIKNGLNDAIVHQAIEALESLCGEIDTCSPHTVECPSSIEEAAFALREHAETIRAALTKPVEAVDDEKGIPCENYECKHGCGCGYEPPQAHIDVEALKIEVLKKYKMGVDPEMNQYVEGVICDTVDHLAPLIRGQEWQPIESAPKDGTPVLTIVTGIYGDTWHDIVRYTGDKHGWFGGDKPVKNLAVWMPLPPPPAQEKIDA